MRKYMILITIITLSLIPYSYAANDFSYNRLYDGTQPIDGFNYSINVNSSENWVTNIGLLSGVNTTQFENDGGQLHLKDTWLTTFINAFGFSTGNIFDQSLNTTDNVTFNEINVTGNITADFFIGNGSLLTGISSGIWESVSNSSQLITPEDINMQDKNLVNVTNITLISSIKDSDTQSRVYFDSEGAFVIEA